MSVQRPRILRPGLVIAILFGLSACGGDGGGGGGGGGGSSNARSNSASFTFDCDLQGMNGVLTMNVEVVQSSGVVWGSGRNPQITAVIGTNDAIYYTAGELRSSTGYYTFTGENSFADFTEVQPPTYNRFRVQWAARGQSLVMIINPFGQGPTQHTCRTSSSRYR